MLFNKLSRKISGANPVSRCETPELVAHRGGADYDTTMYRDKKPKSHDIWESSKTAYRRAVDKGAKVIEMDIHLSKDNEIIILHDDTLDRTTNATGQIADYTMEELDFVFTNKAYNETLPTLEWAFNEFGDGVKYYIEVKSEQHRVETINNRLIQLIDKYDIRPNCRVISFFPNILSYLKKHAPDIKKSFLVYSKSFMSNFFLKFAFMYGVDTISFNYEALNEKLVNECFEAGFMVGAWTVNDIDDYKYMRELGIHSITSDFLFTRDSITKLITDGKA